ncbi:MAG: sialate O-acetylesterase [Myxococcota bacterium]|nr:sialate O-acetylesterase [Myxococcota bacterium]
MRPRATIVWIAVLCFVSHLCGCTTDSPPSTATEQTPAESPLSDKLYPASLFQSNMILQRDVPIPIWGSGDPNTQFTLAFDDEKHTVSIKPDGTWTKTLNARPAGGSHTLRLIGKQTVELNNIAMGDLWLCSGQSNMSWYLSRAQNGREEITKADFPLIRHLNIKHHPTEKPSPFLKSTQWQRATDGQMSDWSAVAYFFAKEIHTQTGVPIGLIHASWGGSTAQAWSPASLLQDPKLEYHLQKKDAYFRKLNQTKAIETFYKDIETWKEAVGEGVNHTDVGIASLASDWMKPEWDDSDWQRTNVPTSIENLAGNIDGAVWFRRTFPWKKDRNDSEALLSLGSIDDFDRVWINGSLVGSTDARTRNARRKKRTYPIPSEILVEGNNHIAIRVFDQLGPGGFTGTPASLFVRGSAESPKIPLAGEWKWSVEKTLPQKPKNPANALRLVGTTLYNGMIHPLRDTPFKGVIWYQGESNVEQAEEYHFLFSKLIQSWRETFQAPELPFYYVQVADFGADEPKPSDPKQARLRDAQRQTLMVPNTGMVVTIDIGNPRDIHPRNKKDVGQRLARHALHNEYGKKQVTSGPRYRGFVVNNNQMIVSFDSVGSGLVLTDGSLESQSFAVAGADKQFYWATATVKDASLIISSPNVENPVALRYGWRNSPNATLFNQDGLPASPFRTDEW